MREQFIARLLEVKAKLLGPVQLHPEAKHMLDMIYRTWPDLEDQRFRHYSTRRFTHLLKLCMIHAAADCSIRIEPQHVIHANTMLCYAETLMPKAMGEMGKGKTNDAANKVMQALFNAKKPMDIQDLWKVARMDLDKPTDLQQVLANLQMAEQIHLVKSESSGKVGYLPKARQISRQLLYIDNSYLKGRELP